jgi:hypothetical protein
MGSFSDAAGGTAARQATSRATAHEFPKSNLKCAARARGGDPWWIERDAGFAAAQLLLLPPDCNLRPQVQHVDGVCGL